MTIMHNKNIIYLSVALLSFGLFFVNNISTEKTPCRIVYDAGSSGTRLYIYQQQNTTWLSHEGPKVSALADPVREIRGKQWIDADAVVNEVVDSLEQIKTNGPDDAKGQARWPAFNWSEQCNVVSANIYATAGMRIAEQQNPDRSKRLWRKLKQRLSEKLGSELTINTRTLTGFEEGLYAWLSIQNEKGHNDFGIAEMGGASSQITFPCNTCPMARPVLLAGQSLNIFSYSFLGLGGDEAAKVFGIKPACAHGAGKRNPQWTEQACADSIQIKSGLGIHDPYNVGASGQGIYQKIPVQHADTNNWVLTGAFYFMQDSDVERCCKQGVECFNAQTSCFRAIYFKKYLGALRIKSYKTAETSWTLGAVICEENNCLRDSGKLKCRWLGEDCL